MVTIKTTDEYTRKQPSEVFCKKKVFLEISQNSQENTCARIYFLKKRPWHSCFPVNFKKFLRTSFLQNTSVRMLLYIENGEATLGIYYQQNQEFGNRWISVELFY